MKRTRVITIAAATVVLAAAGVGTAAAATSSNPHRDSHDIDKSLIEAFIAGLRAFVTALGALLAGPERSSQHPEYLSRRLKC